MQNEPDHEQERGMRSGTWAYGMTLSTRSIIMWIMRASLLSLLLLPVILQAQQPEIGRLFTEAAAAQQQGNNGVAISDYQKVLQLDPKMVDARANLGVALVKEGRFDEAISQYQLVLKAMPANAAVEMNLGLAYYKKGDLVNAAREFSELRKTKLTDLQLAILLGDSEVRSGRSAEALEFLLPLEPENAGNNDFEYVVGTALLGAGRRRDAIERLQKVAEATQGADVYLLAGSTLLDVNEAEKARKDLDEAAQLNPNLPRVYALAGIASDRSGDQKAAEADFRKALQTTPQDFDANLYLGAILLKHRQTEEASGYLQRAVTIDSTSTMARYEMGMFKSMNGQYEAAAAELEAIVNKEPDWLEPHVELATVYYRLHRNADGARERATVEKLRALQQSQGPGKQ